MQTEIENKDNASKCFLSRQAILKIRNSFDDDSNIMFTKEINATFDQEQANNAVQPLIRLLKRNMKVNDNEQELAYMFAILLLLNDSQAVDVSKKFQQLSSLSKPQLEKICDLAQEDFNTLGLDCQVVLKEGLAEAVSQHLNFWKENFLGNKEQAERVKIGMPLRNSVQCFALSFPPPKPVGETKITTPLLHSSYWGKSSGSDNSPSSKSSECCCNIM